MKHTIEPEVTYRYVAGIDNFLNVLRFDDVDVASDTNELEYGVTQRLFLRPVKKPGHAERSRDEDRKRIRMRMGVGSMPRIGRRLEGVAGVRQPRVDQLAADAEVFLQRELWRSRDGWPAQYL